MNVAAFFCYYSIIYELVTMCSLEVDGLVEEMFLYRDFLIFLQIPLWR